MIYHVGCNFQAMLPLAQGNQMVILSAYKPGCMPGIKYNNGGLAQTKEESRPDLASLYQSIYHCKVIDNLNSASPDASTGRCLVRDCILYRRNICPGGPELLLAVPLPLCCTLLKQLNDMATPHRIGITRTNAYTAVFLDGPSPWCLRIHQYLQ